MVKKEKPISKRRLRYLEDKIDIFLHTCLRPNETITLDIQLHDRNVSLTQEGKAGYIIVSKFGTPDD